MNVHVLCSLPAVTRLQAAKGILLAQTVSKTGMQRCAADAQADTRLAHTEGAFLTGSADVHNEDLSSEWPMQAISNAQTEGRGAILTKLETTEQATYPQQGLISAEPLRHEVQRIKQSSYLK